MEPISTEEKEVRKMGRTVYINGKPYVVPVHVTGEDLRRIADIPRERQLVHIRPEGNVIVPKGHAMTVDEGEQFIDLPQGVFGWE